MPTRLEEALQSLRSAQAASAMAITSRQAPAAASRRRAGLASMAGLRNSRRAGVAVDIPVQTLLQEERENQADGSIRMARKSLTLVCVGPEKTRSPSSRK